MTNFELLEQAGFQKFQSTQVPFPWWINLGARMAFSFPAVEDANFEWLSLSSRETAGSGDFLFYFAYGEKMDIDLCGRILNRLRIEGVAPTPQLIVSAR